MSSTTWTPDALRSDLKPFTGECWRVVESQYVISTAVLVDTLHEQARLEELLDATKPPVPAECQHLDVLLFTPFRYTPSKGSRFRRAGQREGVYYTAENVETAVAEKAFYQALFFAESPGTPLPSGFVEHTAFSVSVNAKALLDISETTDPRLTHLWDYSGTQEIADAARAVGADGIKARSVRCPQRGITLSWLTCRVFAQPRPTEYQTWHIRVVPTGVQAVCENPRMRIEFDGRDFAADDRMAPLGWTPYS